MKVEVIAFYPRKIELPKLIEGTMHLYLEELDIDLRGVLIRYLNKKIIIRIPYGKGKDTITGEECAFSVFSFANKMKNLDMIKSIKEEARKYLIDEVILKGKYHDVPM